MKEYLRAVCLCMATLVAVLFATGVVWYGYLVAATLFFRADTRRNGNRDHGDRAGGWSRKSVPGKAEAEGAERGHRKGNSTVGGAYGQTAV